MRGGLPGFIWAQLRHDWRRSSAIIATIAVAVASFLALTASVTTQRLDVISDLHDNYRSTYDILVRPDASVSAAERASGLVRPNFLSSAYSGITMAQVAKVAAVPGVDVAAPVSVIGQTFVNVPMDIDVEKVLAGRQSALVAYEVKGTARNGTAHTASQSGYLYLTRSALTTVDPDPGVSYQAGSDEVRNGKQVHVCLVPTRASAGESPATSFSQGCWTAKDGGSHPIVETALSIPITVAAIDPVAEQQLTGISNAMAGGRFLNSVDAVGPSGGPAAPLDLVPSVMSTDLASDFTAQLTVRQLSDAAINQVMAVDDAAARAKLVRSLAGATVAQKTLTAAAAYRDTVVHQINLDSDDANEPLMVNAFFRPSDVAYTGSSPLTPRTVVLSPETWRNSPTSFLAVPSSVADTSYRTVTTIPRADEGNILSFKVTGLYDPNRVAQPTSSLNQAPLDTYRGAPVAGADASSRSVLGDKPMLSDLNPGGYVQAPPSLLVPLSTMASFKQHFPTMNVDAPVGAIRVRVAGVSGMSSADRERIRLVAEQIKQATGLYVDITIGASLQDQRVQLPATAAGTPALLVNEPWTKKGVAVAIATALDSKSLLLSALVLLSAGLTVTATALAQIQARRRQLAILASLGWPAAKRGLAMTAELVFSGVLGGLVGAGLGLVLGRLLHLPISRTLLWGAPLLGVVLVIIPAIVSGVLAARVAPMAALRDLSVTKGRRGLAAAHGPGSVGVLMIVRHRARLLLAAGAVALSCASIIAVVTIVVRFRGAVVGSYLGNDVALRVRTPDIVATVVLAALGILSVVVILLLGVAQDAGSFAALRAIGWGNDKLVRALIAQGVCVAIVGALVGAVLATVAAGWAAGAWVSAVEVSAVVLLGAIVVCATAALAPASVVLRLPAARLLSAD